MPEDLRRRMIRAAFTDRTLRPGLLPLLKTGATVGEMGWAADEIEEAVGRLRDVHQVLTGRPMGAEPSLADDYAEARKAAELLDKFAKDSKAIVDNLRRRGR